MYYIFARNMKGGWDRDLQEVVKITYSTSYIT